MSKDNSILSSILSNVCEFYCLEESDVKSKLRYDELVIARQVYCYLSRNYTDKGLKEVGSLIGRHHATVCWSLNKINDLIDVGDLVKKDIVEIIENNKNLYCEKIYNFNKLIREGYGKGHRRDI